MPIFKGKEISKERILEEFVKFDSEYPQLNDFKGWLEDGKYRYVIKYNGKIYPPKHILSKASGIPTSGFSGGNEANNFFIGCGFEIQEKIERITSDSYSKIIDTKTILLEKRKQIIVYGPPGTGKTFCTKQASVNLLDSIYRNRNNTISSNETTQPLSNNERIWIFQANPNRYDLVRALSDPNYTKTSWNVAQHKNIIKNGDIVLLWLSGKKSGIYAVGRIISNPFMEKGTIEDTKYWVNWNGGEIKEELSVKMNITDNLVNNPILRETLKNINGLENLSILKFSQATNFHVTEKEWHIIKAIIESRGTKQ